MPFLAFPMRLQENGLLRREDGAASLMALLQMMARTPQGSWAACPEFGLRDLFEHSRLRADTARLALQRMNQTLADLGISGYVVTEVTRELSAGRDTDTYAITVESTAKGQSFSTSVRYEQ